MTNVELTGFKRASGLYGTIQESTFIDHAWQDKHSIIRIEQLEKLIAGVASPAMIEEIRTGLAKVGMSIRLNPYMLDLIDWRAAESDPIRRQFLPMVSELEQDHPCATIDSLDERHTSPVPNLIHRYPDKVLFLVTSVCPVYCQYCTRSYAVGQDTPVLHKDNVTSASGWSAAIDYIRANPQIEDVVVSGGDVARLKPQNVLMLGNALLDIEHIRRIRFATKALAVAPMKFLTDDAWFSAIAEVARRGRSMFKSVFLHTHFNHPREVTPLVEAAMRRLFSESIYVRNQSVLLRGVNDETATMIDLVKKLGRVNIQPYYVYSCDMVRGAEHFRVPIAEMQRLERQVRGATAGFNTPLFIVDTPGGGGKRDVHSFEFLDETYGVFGYTSPSIDPDRIYYYYDPLRALAPAVRDEWTMPGGADRILTKLSPRAGLLNAAE